MQIAINSTRTLTRSASASNVLSQLPTCKTRSLTCQKDYALDKIKALEKENISCTKEHMECSMKPGSNLVLEFSMNLSRKYAKRAQ